MDRLTVLTNDLLRGDVIIDIIVIIVGYENGLLAPANDGDNLLIEAFQGVTGETAVENQVFKSSALPLLLFCKY